MKHCRWGKTDYSGYPIHRTRIKLIEEEPEVEGEAEGQEIPAGPPEPQPRA